MKSSNSLRALALHIILVTLIFLTLGVNTDSFAADRARGWSSPLGKLWSWATKTREDEKASAPSNDESSVTEQLLDNVELDVIADQIKNTTGDAGAIQALEAGKAQLIRVAEQSTATRENIQTLKKGVDETAYKMYKSGRKASPNLGGLEVAGKVDKAIDYGARSRRLKDAIAKVDEGLAANARAQRVLDGKIADARTAPNRMGKLKGLLKYADKMMTLIDVAGAVGRVGSDMADVFDGTGRLQNVLERIGEEYGRMKTVSMGAAAGASAGGLAGPLAPIAAPIGAMVAGAEASELYERTVSDSLEKLRQERADERARSKFEVEAETLAETRAANRTRTAIAKRRSELQARGREYEESLKYLDDMRAKIAAMYERDRAIEEKARQELAAREKLLTPARTQARVKPVSTIAKVQPKISPAPVKTTGGANSGTIVRTYANEVNQFTVIVTGADLIQEDKPRKIYDTDAEGRQIYTLSGGNLRLAARGPSCTITIRYSVSGVEPGYDTYRTHVDFLEMDKEWTNLGQVKYNITNEPYNRGLGVRTGEITIPVTVNKNIKKYMIFTETALELGEVILSVLVVSSENRHYFDD